MRYAACPSCPRLRLNLAQHHPGERLAEPLLRLLHATLLVDDEAFSGIMKATLTHAFENEDEPMLERQQDRMKTSDLWSLNPILLPADAAAMRVRRKLACMIETESA
jgi:hypothetical protein